MTMAGRFSRYRLFSLVVCILLLPAAASGQRAGAGAQGAGAPLVSGIQVRVAGESGEPEKMERIARNLINMEEGEPFSADQFAGALEALRKSGLFSSIDVPDPDWDAPEISLLFRLNPFSRVKEIRVRGGFPLLEREIRNAMTLQVGDAFVPEALSTQEQRIEELFSKEGYIRPEVRASADKDPADGHALVDIEIRKGPFYHLADVRITGNNAFSDFRLKMRLHTWQASILWGGPSRFVEEKLTEDLRTLRRFYRKKGYCEVEVDSGLEKDRESGAVRVRIRIAEGPRYRVRFSGNEAFLGLTLRKDLVLFAEGNAGGLGVSRSLRGIRERYRRAGYLDAVVKAREEEAAESRRLITMVIDEGPRYLVQTVAVSGNRAFSAEKVKKQMLTAPPGLLHRGAYVPDVLDADMRAVEALYLENGYSRVEVSSRVEERRKEGKEGVVSVFVHLSINEGPQTKVAGVSVAGVPEALSDAAEEALSMKAGKPFEPYRLEAEKTRIASRVAEEGYPHVEVAPQVSLGPEGRSADIVYQVDSGPFVKMGQALFAGNFKTRRSVLAREVEMEQGEPFSLSRMLSSQRNIRSLNAVAAARFKTFGLSGKADEVDMLSEIQEIRPYFLEFAAGYDTRRQMYLNLAGGSGNLFGLNKELRAGLEWSQIGYRAELGLSEPRFFGSRIASNTNLYSEELEEQNKDFGLRTYGASLGLSRQLSRHLDASLNFQFEYREQYRTDEQPVPEDERDAYEPRSLLVATPSVVYNSTDSFVRPGRGVRASFSVDASKGLENSLDDFFKYRLEGRCYYSPLNRLTLAARARIGYIDPFNGESRIPEDQLFFLGGIADVRGFSENRLRFDSGGDPVGGRTALLGSLEARFDMGMNFELAAFYDTGAVREPLEAAGSSEFRSSAGLALRYITPIGPVGGMYGWKLDRKAGESPGAFHFAIGYSF